MDSGQRDPADLIDGLNRGDYVLHGGVIRSAPSTDGAGQIVRHLLPTGQDLPDSVAASSVLDLTLARTTQNLLHATTGTMLISGMNLAVTAVGFGVLYKKLTELRKSLSEIKDSVDGIVRLLELDERAKLMFALEQLSIVTRKGPPGKREQPLLHHVLTALGPAKVKYQELLPGARFETATACQEYFTLTSLAVAACWAELGSVDVARDNLERDYKFWVEQARRIAGEDLLVNIPNGSWPVSSCPMCPLANWPPGSISSTTNSRANRGESTSCARGSSCTPMANLDS